MLRHLTSALQARRVTSATTSLARSQSLDRVLANGLPVAAGHILDWFHSATFCRGHKTVSSVKKRFRLTGSGNVKRGQAGMRHNTGPKSRSRLRPLGQTRQVQGKQKKKLLWMLGS